MADLSATYRTVLSQEYQRRVGKNPSYSRSAFARSLGIDRTYYSKLSQGSILLSLDIADQMTKKLKLEPAQRAEFLLSVAEEHHCHALYLIDPSLTDCAPEKDTVNRLPAPRKKASKKAHQPC